MLNYCVHETSRCSQLYNNNPDFTTTYQLLGAGTLVVDFYLQDGLLCHSSHLYVPSSEHAKMTWESHYSQVVGHFYVKNIVAVLQKYFICRSSNRVSTSISDCVLHMSSPNHPLKRKGCTHLYQLLTGLRIPSQCITCLAYPQPSMTMTAFCGC